MCNFSFGVGLFLFLVISTQTDAFTCLDENGNPVDSWVALKGAPKTSIYFIYDESLGNFKKSIYNVSQSTNGAIMQTVGQLYVDVNAEEIAFGMYNDEAPDKDASSSYAHGKGILATNAKEGFWLVHSMPKWPNYLKDGGPGPFPDYTYGQSLMCVSISMSTSNLIASNLMVEHPYIYDKFMPSTLQPSLPAFADLLLGVKSSLKTSNSSFTSLLGNETFYQLSKSSSDHVDFWDDIAAPYFQTDLNVETWRSGSGGRMSSICGSNGEKVAKFDIYEINKVAMPGPGDYSWTGTQDHSKWASSLGRLNNPVSCVGDMNRMCSQESRGGGTMCSKNYGLWSAFNSSIRSIESCYQYDPCLGTSTQCYWCPSKAPTSSPVSKSPLAITSANQIQDITKNSLGVDAMLTDTIIGISIGVAALIFGLSLALLYMSKCSPSFNSRLNSQFFKDVDSSSSDTETPLLM